MILAGDIGGTNTRLALFERQGNKLVMGAHQDFRSHDYRALEDVLRVFLDASGGQVEAACFGIAGPVLKNRVSATNLAWIVDAVELSRVLGTKTTLLLNDLVAYAYGALEVPATDLTALQAGDAAAGNRALIAAGTGLGEAGLLWHEGHYVPIATEGGHVDFAPIDDLGVDLYRFLRARFGRVSNERVISGQGLQNIYEFLRDTGRTAEPDSLKQEFAAAPDVPAAISRHGMAGDSPICEQALELFCRMYGAAAGNLALKFMATGGVYIGGGIAAKILSKLQEPGFVKAFGDKGRFSPMLQKIPVWVIRNDHAGLLGAARAAAAAGVASNVAV